MVSSFISFLHDSTSRLLSFCHNAMSFFDGVVYFSFYDSQNGGCRSFFFKYSSSSFLFFFSALDLEKVTQHLVGFLWFPGHTHTRALFAHAALSSHRSNSTVFFCFLSPSVSHCSPSHSFTFPIYLSSFVLGALCVCLQYLCACPSDGKEVVDGFVYLVVAAGLGGWWWWLPRWIEELIYQWK
jgi:hypothetical protein